MIIWRYVYACSVASFMSDCKPMDCSPPGSSVHGILQARILEWMPCPPPGDLPNPGMEPTSPALQADSSPTRPSGKPLIRSYLQPKLLKHFKQKDALDKSQIAFQRQLFSSVQFSSSVVSGSLRPHGLQHTRPPYPLSTSRVCSDSCPLSQWCHPIISWSVVPFSHLQSLPASRSF